MCAGRPRSSEIREAMQACRDDASKLCAGVKPGGGRIAICLREKKASLTPDCLTQIEKLEVCGADTKRPCKDPGK